MCAATGQSLDPLRSDLQSDFWTRALAGSNELVFVVSTDRRIVAASGGAIRALGCVPGDLTGRSCVELMHGDGLPAECPLARLLADGCAHDGDVHSATLGRDFFVTVTPLPDERGNVVGAVHTAYDMTERRRIEERLRESEATVRTLVENASDLMTRIDRDLRCVYVSPAVETWLGRKPAEFLGRKLGDLGLSPGFLDLYGDALRRALTGRQAVDVEFSFVGPAGSRHVEARCTPEFDASGEAVSVISVMRDVTERVKSDEALLEREERLRHALGDTVAALGATVAQRDPYTAGHEVRVAELACLIAERLGWHESALGALRTAALVHDVGKIAIPAEILSKPTRLTVPEFELIKAHPRAGYDILAGIAFEDHVADVVLQHHERLDGSGYPAGLRGPGILPAALVLAVADVVEAMVSHRPYRPARTVDEAIAEIRQGLGCRYDADAASACLHLLVDEAFDFSAS